MRVSVIIPVYQAARWVEEAARSCLDQPEVREVLLVDDGSTDGSYEILERLASQDNRVRVLTHPHHENRGVASTRNLGIRESTMPFLAFLDADDRYLPHRFRAAGDRFAADEDADGVYDPVERIFENEAVEAAYRARGRLVRYAVRQPMPPESLFRALVKGDRGLFVTQGLVIRRSLLEKAGLFPEHLEAGEDTALSLRMAAVGRLVAGEEHEVVAEARVHGDNLSERLWDGYPDLWASMWRDLMTWSRGRALRPADQKLIAERLVRSALEREGGAGSAAWLGLLARDPPMLLRGAWWKAFPGRRLFRGRR